MCVLFHLSSKRDYTQVQFKEHDLSFIDSTISHKPSY